MAIRYAALTRAFEQNMSRAAPVSSERERSAEPIVTETYLSSARKFSRSRSAQMIWVVQLKIAAQQSKANSKRNSLFACMVPAAIEATQPILDYPTGYLITNPRRCHFARHRHNASWILCTLCNYFRFIVFPFLYR